MEVAVGVWPWVSLSQMSVRRGFADCEGKLQEINVRNWHFSSCLGESKVPRFRIRDES